MKNNAIVSNHSLVFNAHRNEWYAIIPSVYSGSSFMLKRLNSDGTHATVQIGSYKGVLKRLATIRQSIEATTPEASENDDNCTAQRAAECVPGETLLDGTEDL